MSRPAPVPAPASLDPSPAVICAHDQRRREFLSACADQSALLSSRAFAAIQAMRFSLVHHVPSSPALLAEFLHVHSFALENQRQLPPNSQADLHALQACFLFQQGNNPAANKELDVALERGNATWRRLGWIVCLTADRSAIDLRDLRLNSSHLFVHRTAETISMRADDRALLVPARMMPGQPGVLVTFQLPNESGQDAIDRYYRITGNRSEAPSKLLPLPVRTESRKLRIDQDEFDSAADSLSLNTEEWSGRRKEERATALTTDSVQLFALGFNDAAFELERKTGACARFSQMAGAFGDMPNALPVQRVSRLADILPVLLVSPSRSVWVVSHGGHDGTYGSDSRSDVIAFLRHLHESVEQLSTLILFGCDLAQAVLSEVRHVLCPELEGPLRFHLLAFHDPIYGTNCNAADLMRSMLSEDLRFCNIHASQDARDTMRAHRADARRLFQQMGVRPLAEQGFTKLEKLSFVEQALVLCTVRNEELPAQEANDAEFVPCSVYLHFLDKFGRVIGAGADVDANAEIIAGLAGLGSSA